MEARGYSAEAENVDAKTEDGTRAASCSTVLLGAEHRMKLNTMLEFQIREYGLATANARGRSR